MTAMTHAANLSYFDNLPRYLLTSLQAAWDKAQTKVYSTKVITGTFRKECNGLGYEAPTPQVMNQWVAGVQCGSIARPGGPAAQVPADELAPDIPMIHCSLPDVSLAVDVGTVVRDESLEASWSRLVDDLARELEKDIQSQAYRYIAGMLRVKADELEGMAA